MLQGTLGTLAVSACARCVVPEMLANALISIWLMITMHSSLDDHSSLIPLIGLHLVSIRRTTQQQRLHVLRLWNMTVAYGVWPDLRESGAGPAGSVRRGRFSSRINKTS